MSGLRSWETTGGRRSRGANGFVPRVQGAGRTRIIMLDGERDVIQIKNSEELIVSTLCDLIKIFV